MGDGPLMILISESVFRTALGALVVGRVVHRDLLCCCLHRNSLLTSNVVVSTFPDEDGVQRGDSGERNLKAGES